MTRKTTLFSILTAIFITNLIVAEAIGPKLFHVNFFNLRQFTLTAGTLAWPVVFLSTDVVNEFFGKRGVRLITWTGAVMALYMFLIVNWALRIPGAADIPGNVSDEAFKAVFGQSSWIIAGSLTAFLISQFVDAHTFHFIKKFTESRYIWARATGSTLLSQLIDSFVVIFVAFVVPGKMGLATFWTVSSSNYQFKVVVAVVLTPLIYLGHSMVRAYLGKEADELAKESR